MSRQIKIALITVFGLLVAGAVAFGLTNVFRGPTSADENSVVLAKGDTKTSDGGGVQIEASFAPSAASSNALLFEISMNTHSVELGEYDLSKLSQVTVEPGGTLTEAKWQPQGSSGGHHIAGTLTLNDPKGLLATAKTVKLEIRDVAGVPVREFLWQVEKP